MLRVCVLLALAVAVRAEVPEPYRQVDRIVFVVPNAARAAVAWVAAGVPLVPVRTVEVLEVGGTRLRVRMATAQFENVSADFIEPVTPRGVFSEHLRRTGGGVFALVHRVATVAALAAELERARKAGVLPAADTTWRDGKTTNRCVYLDTFDQGKYSLALAVMPERSVVDNSRRVVQFAFVAKDLDVVSAYWEKLGIPPMSYSRPDSSELVYRGQPGKFDMRLGWQRHGKVVYEWIQPLAGPSTYEDHLARHGEGVHHIAFNVDDMDEGNIYWDKLGFPVVMSGAWGKKGEPGSGRFAYHDADPCCGVEIELLWNWKAR